jgi:hypothetical protein
MNGATHTTQAGEPVKCIKWNKDGDHSKVVRYPIERREFKGLLEVDAKTKFALRFGDWICEDAQGRLWAVSPDKFGAYYSPIGGVK